MDYKKKFIPLCFEKDVSKLSSQFKIPTNKKSDKILTRELSYNPSISAKDVYTIIKNLDFSLDKCQKIEYSRQRLKIKQANKLLRVSKNCDVYKLKLQTKFLNFFKYEIPVKMIRFYSFSIANNSYFFLFQVVDETNDKIKFCKGGIIIPTHEKKIVLYMKKSKKLSNVNHRFFFDMLVENLKVILEVMGKFITPEEVERLSTVETLETERDSFITQSQSQKKVEFNTSPNFGSGYFNFENEKEVLEDSVVQGQYIMKSKCAKFSPSKISHINKNSVKEEEEIDSKYSQNVSLESSFCDEIVDYTDIDLYNINYNSSKEIYLVSSSCRNSLEINKITTCITNCNNDNNLFQELNLNPIQVEQEKSILELHEINEQAHSHFIIDESDEDYRFVRKMTESELEKHKFLEAYQTLCKEMENEIKEYKIEENDLIRYIYGWKGDVVNVKKVLIELHFWKNSYRPDLISLEEFSFEKTNFDFKNLLHIACQDIYGRPIILIKAKNLIANKLNIDLFGRYLIYTLVECIKLMPQNIDKLAIVIDIKDAGISNFSMNHIKPIKDLTSKFFVERLSTIIIVNRGFFFGMIWKFVSAFLEERVLKKIVVIDDKKMPWLEKILGENINTVL